MCIVYVPNPQYQWDCCTGEGSYNVVIERHWWNMVQICGPEVVVDGNSCHIDSISHQQHEADCLPFANDDKIREIFSKSECNPKHHWSPSQEYQDLKLIPLLGIFQDIFSWNQEKRACNDASKKGSTEDGD